MLYILLNIFKSYVTEYTETLVEAIAIRVRLPSFEACSMGQDIYFSEPVFSSLAS